MKVWEVDLAVAAACFAGCLACASSHTALVHMASNDLGCSENQVRVTDEGDRYRAGCGGHSRIYECYAGTCAEEGFLAPKARERAKREFGCNQEIAVRWVNEDTSHVEACGHAATYDCDDDGCYAEGAKESVTVVSIPVITR